MELSTLRMRSTRSAGTRGLQWVHVGLGTQVHILRLEGRLAGSRKERGREGHRGPIGLRRSPCFERNDVVTVNPARPRYREV
jgi:hypothetical protein